MLRYVCAVQRASSHCKLLDRRSYQVIGRKACYCGTFWGVGRERALFYCQRLKLCFISLDSCLTDKYLECGKVEKKRTRI